MIVLTVTEKTTHIELDYMIAANKKTTSEIVCVDRNQFSSIEKLFSDDRAGGNKSRSVKLNAQNGSSFIVDVGQELAPDIFAEIKFVFLDTTTAIAKTQQELFDNLKKIRGWA